MFAKIQLCLLCIFPAFAATSFTFGESIDVANRAEFQQIILDNQEYCIKTIEEEKIYLKSNEIYPCDEGVFLRLNLFDLVRLPEVFSDDNGCYITFFEE